MKKSGNKSGLRGFMSTLAAMLLTAAMSITALADGVFAGDITITNVLAGYEYKVFEVLDCIAAGGNDSVFMATENWKEFLKTNQNAVAMLTPQENNGQYPMAEKGDELYTVNMESDKAVREAFAADVLKYAAENGIEATESRTAGEGDSEVSFTGLMLGTYVIDTAGRARIIVMWDMEWQSEIKESYKPEAQGAGDGAEAEGDAQTRETGSGAANGGSALESSVTETGNGTETDNAEAARGAEESGNSQDAAADTETENGEESAESPASAEDKVPEGKSMVPVVIVAAVIVLAVAVALVFVKGKK